MLDQTIYETLRIHSAYLEVFIIMLISFLIGYFSAFYAQKSKYDKTSKGTLDTMTDLTEDKPFMERVTQAHLKEPITEKTVPFNPLKGKAQEQHNEYLDLIRLGYGSVADKNDLQRIVGIGPFTEKKLNAIGIYTYLQISRLNNNDIEIVTELIKFFPDRIKNDKWTEQAKMLNDQYETEQQQA